MAESSNMAMPQTQTRTATPSTGGSTTVQVRPQPVLRLSAPSGTLRLRAEPTEQRHIQWAEDVVDNEGMGKKSSKVCCIYHKPRAIDESSDESSSDDSSDSSDSDSDVDDGSARPAGGRKGGNSRGRRPHQHDHGDEHDGCEHDHDNGEDPAKKRSRPQRKPSPNAYEKMPKQK